MKEDMNKIIVTYEMEAKKISLFTNKMLKLS
jgi:hypothetical protein